MDGKLISCLFVISFHNSDSTNGLSITTTSGNTTVCKYGDDMLLHVERSWIQAKIPSKNVGSAAAMNLPMGRTTTCMRIAEMVNGLVLKVLRKMRSTQEVIPRNHALKVITRGKGSSVSSIGFPPSCRPTRNRFPPTNSTTENYHSIDL